MFEYIFFVSLFLLQFRIYVFSFIVTTLFVVNNIEEEVFKEFFLTSL